MAVMKVKQGDQWIPIPSITGAPGPQGIQGNTGNSGVYVGTTAPTDPDVNVWVNPDGDEWDPVSSMQDGSLTEEKIDSETLLALKNNYVTPEMFGAKGDGATDDTQAIKALISSGNKEIYFANKTYMISDSIDFVGPCVLHFNDTTLATTRKYSLNTFEYMIGFAGSKITTTGKLRVNCARSVNIGVWLSSCGNSHFDEIQIDYARIWGLCTDASGTGYIGLGFNSLSTSQCGYKLHCKGKYISNTSVEISNINGNIDQVYFSNGVIEDLFSNNYGQAEMYVDDSLYQTENLRNRLVLLNQRLQETYVLDAEDKTKAIFNFEGGTYCPSDYKNDEDGRIGFIPIGGGVNLVSSRSEGIFLINQLSTQSGPLSFRLGLTYGGTIINYASTYDTLVMKTGCYALNILHTYFEAIGDGFTNYFNNAYDRIYSISPNSNARTYVFNPFIGSGRDPFMQGNWIVDNHQMLPSTYYEYQTLVCPSFLSQKKNNGITIGYPSTNFNQTVDELFPRSFSVDALGYSNGNGLTITLRDINKSRTNTFSPMTLYVHRRRTNSDYDMFRITLSNNLVNAGYSLYGAIDNKITIAPSEYDNFVKITITLMIGEKTFYVFTEKISPVTNAS